VTPQAEHTIVPLSAEDGFSVTSSGEELFRAMTAHGPVGVFVNDTSGSWVYVNDRLCDLLQRSREEALGDGWLEAIHPEDADRVHAEWARASADGVDFASEYRFRTRTGRVSWVECFASAVANHEGRLVAWVGTCVDVTPRKEAEDAIALAGDRFRAAFDDAPIGMAIVAPGGRWLETNEVLQKMLGYSADELSERTFADDTHPDDLALSLESRQGQLHGSAREARIEKRFVRSNGETVWTAVSSTLIRSPTGELLYSVAQIEDITARVLTQRALEEAEERFRRAFDDAPIGMALVAPDGRFVLANHSLCELLGYDESELLARTFQDITHPEDLASDVQQAERLLAGEIRSYQLEKRYYRSDGQLIWVMLSVSLVRAENGEPLHFVSQIEDISARKAADLRLRELADHDPLTGLLNRRRFREELAWELDLIGRNGNRRAAVLILDVDRFKLVNDSLGHPAGDEVLQAVGQTLRRRLRRTDVIARLGGDEFGVILPDVADSSETSRIAGEIAEEVRSRAIATSHGAAGVTVSIGVVGLDARDVGRDQDALAAADRALYRAKEQGRDGVSLPA
jgi:diguanylate cyclase (GGDEF)-like protein/PAS domain S-box-containing protein